jgi:hypothetical protein
MHRVALLVVVVATRISPRLQGDFLVVHVGDGRRRFIPSDAVGGGSCIRLGRPKYAVYEVERDQPLAVIAEARLGTLADPWRGSRAVKGDAL